LFLRVVFFLRSRRSINRTKVVGFKTVDESRLRLTDFFKEFNEPWVVDVERTTTLNAFEFDSTKLAFVLDIVADETALATKGAVDGVIAEALDETEIVGVGGGRTGEVAALLDEDLLGAEGLAEALSEPLADVEGVELDVAEGVLHEGFAAGLHVGDDEREHGALAHEHVDAAVLVHDGLQTLLLGLEVEGHLGNVHAVDVEALGEEAELLEPGAVLAAGEELAVVVEGALAGQITAVAAHDLVDEEHAGVRGHLVHDVLEEHARLLGGGKSAETLAKREDVVVDGLGQADHGKVVVVLLKVGGKVGGGGVGIITTNRVKDVDLVLDQLISANLTRILALLDQTALKTVSNIAQLHTAVANRTATILVKEEGVLAHFRRYFNAAALKKALITIKITNDAYFRGNFTITINQCSNAT